MSTLAARVDPDLTRVWQWFSFQRDVLIEAHLHVAAVAARPTLTAEGASGRSYEKQFRGQTPLEVEAFFSTQQAELEFLTIFELTASVEAALRLNFDSRITNRGKDRISRKFRSHLNPSHVSLDADILEVWSTEANVKVGEFRGLFNLRHWLAHGRHWRPKIGQAYSAADAYRIATKLLIAVQTAPDGL